MGRDRQEWDSKPVGAVGIVGDTAVVVANYVGGGSVDSFRSLGGDGDVVSGACPTRKFIDPLCPRIWAPDSNYAKERYWRLSMRFPYGASLSFAPPAYA